ncbi:MAG: hypothetical protein KAS87_05165 [Candidatus Omnitrophica bacterium]|nr:hypothetical protein [Candidatus Omnitrophota bacterium]
MPCKTILKSKNPKMNLDKYAGEWVAFVDDKLALHNKSLNKLMCDFKKAKPKKKPSVFLVPRKDEGPYILIVS